MAAPPSCGGRCHSAIADLARPPKTSVSISTSCTSTVFKKPCIPKKTSSNINSNKSNKFPGETACKSSVVSSPRVRTSDQGLVGKQVGQAVGPLKTSSKSAVALLPRIHPSSKDDAPGNEAGKQAEKTTEHTKRFTVPKIIIPAKRNVRQQTYTKDPQGTGKSSVKDGGNKIDVPLPVASLSQELLPSRNNEAAVDHCIPGGCNSDEVRSYREEKMYGGRVILPRNSDRMSPRHCRSNADVHHDVPTGLIKAGCHTERTVMPDRCDVRPRVQVGRQRGRPAGTLNGHVAILTSRDDQSTCQCQPENEVKLKSLYTKPTLSARYPIAVSMQEDPAKHLMLLTHDRNVRQSDAKRRLSAASGVTTAGYEPTFPNRIFCAPSDGKLTKYTRRSLDAVNLKAEISPTMQSRFTWHKKSLLDGSNEPQKSSSFIVPALNIDDVLQNGCQSEAEMAAVSDPTNSDAGSVKGDSSSIGSDVILTMPFSFSTPDICNDGGGEASADADFQGSMCALGAQPLLEYRTPGVIDMKTAFTLAYDLDNTCPPPCAVHETNAAYVLDEEQNEILYRHRPSKSEQVTSTVTTAAADVLSLIRNYDRSDFGSDFVSTSGLDQEASSLGIIHNSDLYNDSDSNFLTKLRSNAPSNWVRNDRGAVCHSTSPELSLSWEDADMLPIKNVDDRITPDEQLRTSTPMPEPSKSTTKQKVMEDLCLKPETTSSVTAVKQVTVIKSDDCAKNINAWRASNGRVKSRKLEKCQSCINGEPKTLNPTRLFSMQQKRTSLNSPVNTLRIEFCASSKKKKRSETGSKLSTPSKCDDPCLQDSTIDSSLYNIDNGQVLVKVLSHTKDQRSKRPDSRGSGSAELACVFSPAGFSIDCEFRNDEEYEIFENEDLNHQPSRSEYLQTFDHPEAGTNMHGTCDMKFLESDVGEITDKEFKEVVTANQKKMTSEKYNRPLKNFYSPDADSDCNLNEEVTENMKMLGKGASQYQATCTSYDSDATALRTNEDENITVFADDGQNTERLLNSVSARLAACPQCTNYGNSCMRKGVMSNLSSRKVEPGTQHSYVKMESSTIRKRAFERAIDSGGRTSLTGELKCDKTIVGNMKKQQTLSDGAVPHSGSVPSNASCAGGHVGKSNVSLIRTSSDARLNPCSGIGHCSLAVCAKDVSGISVQSTRSHQDLSKLSNSEFPIHSFSHYKSTVADKTSQTDQRSCVAGTQTEQKQTITDHASSTVMSREKFTNHRVSLDSNVSCPTKEMSASFRHKNVDENEISRQLLAGNATSSKVHMNQTRAKQKAELIPSKTNNSREPRAGTPGKQLSRTRAVSRTG